MQNYEQIFKELGIEISEDKKEALKSKMTENYRSKADYDKAVEKREEYKTSLEEVQTKLDGFKDVDVDDLQNQISTLTTQLNDEKEARKKDEARNEPTIEQLRHDNAVIDQYTLELMRARERVEGFDKSSIQRFSRSTWNSGSRRNHIFIVNFDKVREDV